MADPITPPADDWKAGLAEDIRSNPSLDGIADVGALAKSFIDTKQMVGDSIRVPAADAKPEEWDKTLYSKIGWPEKQDGYSRIDKTTMKDGEWGWNEAFENKWYEIAHKNRLNNKQANAMLQDLNGNQIETFKSEQVEAEQKLTEAKAKMETEFGNSLPAKLEQAKRFITNNADAAFVEQINNNGWGDNPGFLSMMIKISDQHVEDHSISVQRGVSGLTSTPEAIKAQIAEIQKSPEHLDPNNVKHPETIKRLTELHKMLVPTKAAS